MNGWMDGWKDGSKRGWADGRNLEVDRWDIWALTLGRGKNIRRRTGNAH